MQLFEDNVTDPLGNALPRASYYVYTDSSRTTLATLFKADLSSESNPVLSDALGYISFRAADGKYYVTVSGIGIATPQTREIILFDPTASNSAASINVVQSGTPLGVTRTAAAKMGETASAKDSIGETYGTDDTTAFQNRITSEASAGREVLVNAGTLIETGVTLPGTANQQVSLRGDPQTVIKAKASATNAVLVQVANDITRTGFREIKSLKIDGNSVSGVTGIKSGNTTAAALQLYLRSLDIRSCAVGLDLYSAMEGSNTDVVLYSNTVGMQLRQDTTNGGGNANRFDGLRLQSNTVGALIDGASVFPMGAALFNQPLIQSNTLCGMAFFDVDNAIQINAAHFEANATAGTTSSVNGRTVKKCALQLNNSIATVADSSFGETCDPCIILESGARLTLRDSGGYGSSSGTFISGTLSESVEFYGHHDALGKCTAYVARWPDSISVASGSFMAIGSPVIQPTARITNDYVASTPTVPTLANAVNATINADAGDAEMGMVSNVTYTALAGSTAANRVTMNALPTGVTSGDTWAVTFMVKASASTNIGFEVTSGSFATFSSCPVDTKWRRVVIAFKASTSNTPLLYAYAVGTDAPTVYFAKLQSLRIASGGDLTKISETVALGLFNNNQNQFSYTAAPTTGTWKKGDLVWNTAPTSTSAAGWICTTAGTPGTWTNFADRTLQGTITATTNAAIRTGNSGLGDNFFFDVGTATFRQGNGGNEGTAKFGIANVMYNTATPAGGTAGAGLKFGTTANFGIFFGSGAPTLSAAKGSLYMRSDGGGTTDRMYVNTDGSTTWTAVTTVA